MTEDQIEVAVERRIDRLDDMLMRGEIDQKKYDREIIIVDKWASQQYKNLDRS